MWEHFKDKISIYCTISVILYDTCKEVIFSCLLPGIKIQIKPENKLELSWYVTQGYFSRAHTDTDTV